MTISNQVNSFENVLKQTKELAKTQGQGSSARANWLINVVRGGADGVLDTIKRDKDGNENVKDGKDHAYHLYKAWESVSNSANTHDEKTVTAKASNLRGAIDFGNRWGDDAIAVVNDIGIVRKEMLKNETPVWSMYESINRVIVRHKDRATRMSRDEIYEAIAQEKKDRDATAFLKTAEKALEKACALDDTDDARNALEATKRALAAYMAEEQKAKDLAALAELQARLGIAA